jgi:signal transduction histidine kinase
MKIKTKLSLLFTFLITLFLIVLNIYVYSISKSYASGNFFSMLQQRTYATANFYLEEDEVSKKIFDGFKAKFLEKIPGEIIHIYDSKNQPVFLNQISASQTEVSIIEKTRKQKVFKSKQNGAYTYGIFYPDNQGDFVILVTAVDTTGDGKLKHLGNVLIFGFFLSLIVLYFIGQFFTKKMLKPINEIIHHVNKITDTNLNLRLSEGTGKDELAELAITFNNMLERLENSFLQQQNFIAGASHELRTPLTSIIGNIEVLLSRERTTNEYKNVLVTVLGEAESLHKLSDGLLSIAQANSGINSLKMELVRVDELLEESKNLVQNQMPGSKMDLFFENMPENSDDLIIRGNKNLLIITLVNIFENANKFSNYKKVQIKLNISSDSIIITVMDKGIGIPEKDIDNIFQTFFRAENAHSYTGSGVGLAICQKIIQLHNGKLSIKSEQDEGTIVTIMLNKS